MKKNNILLVHFFIGIQYLLGSPSVIDNRYFPWNTVPMVHAIKPYSGITSNLFFNFADSAYSGSQGDKVGISEIWGLYNEKQMSDALLFIGQTTPLLAQWQYWNDIIWNVRQKIEGQGIQIIGEHALYKGFSFGYNTGFMHVFSDQLFTLPKALIRELTLTIPQQEELDRERRIMFDQLELTESPTGSSGMLDTVLYLRYGGAWDYQAKCRSVSLGLLAGIIAPTGQTRTCTNPSSVPFGGNGATGFIIGTDNSFELKEDLTCGFYLQLTTRSKKTITERMTTKENTNYLFGALQGPVSLDQGCTVRFSPYVLLGNLRDGFDIYAQYSLTHHADDVWVDMRQNPTIPSNLNGIAQMSEWMSDYLSLTLLYDSGKVVKKDSIHTAFKFTWDIPLRLLNAHSVSRTQVANVGIEISF